MTTTVLRSVTLALLTLAATCDERDFSPEESEAFVRRNLFEGSGEFPISGARAYQYGHIHVDGPTGGMLYRFQTPPAAVDWLIQRWELHTATDTPADAFPEFESVPKWWPDKSPSLGGYWIVRRPVPGSGDGSETLILFHGEDAEPTVYFVSHLQNVRGV